MPWAIDSARQHRSLSPFETNPCRTDAGDRGIGELAGQGFLVIGHAGPDLPGRITDDLGQDLPVQVDQFFAGWIVGALSYG